VAFMVFSPLPTPCSGLSDVVMPQIPTYTGAHSHRPL
jgi:hypothetical protein